MSDAIRPAMQGDEREGRTPGRPEEAPAPGASTGMTGGAELTEPGADVGVTSGTKATATEANLAETEAVGMRAGA